MTEEGSCLNEMWTLNNEMKLELMYKVGSECELNSWPNSTVTAPEGNSVVVGGLTKLFFAFVFHQGA